MKLDVCEGGCGGIWFDAQELKRVERENAGAADLQIQVSPDPAVPVDHSIKRGCPRCDGMKLKRHFFSAKRQVEVDQCPNCGGYWLDAGELEKIHEEKTHSAAAQKINDTEVSMASIRFLYRQKLQERIDAA